MNNFNGFEVQSFGVTVSWTKLKQEADKAFREAHGHEVVMYQHLGQTKKLIARK
jgi:hypothetical protein